MPLYRDHVYSGLVSLLGNPKPIQEVRERILPLAHGNVLEIGFGPGVNLAYYDPTAVRTLYALEPSDSMIHIAERHPRRSAFAITFLEFPGERIPLKDGAIDTVVSTFTLCTVSNVADVMAGIARVTRPGGKLIFLENTASPDLTILQWQRRWRPLACHMFAGLDLTRDIPSVIKAAGCVFERIESGYLARFPKSWSHCCWGSAVFPITN